MHLLLQPAAVMLSTASHLAALLPLLLIQLQIPLLQLLLQPYPHHQRHRQHHHLCCQVAGSHQVHSVASLLLLLLQALLLPLLHYEPAAQQLQLPLLQPPHLHSRLRQQH
jgi:hypothetical protein